MNKVIHITLLSALFILIFSIIASFASAIRFDIEQARQEEWDRFEAYKADYIKFNDLEAFSDHVNEFNLARNFGFYGPDYYYIPPDVWQAKYNPPLQGDVYYTQTRGYTSSLYSPSAVQYYGDEINGRYSGYIPSTLNGKYFDHPQMYGAYGAQSYLTIGRPGYGAYGYDYGYGYKYGFGYGYNLRDLYSDEPAAYSRIADPLTGGFYVIGYY